jgi:oxygen-independent coproporphyrinogen-3 oxidase
MKNSLIQKYNVPGPRYTSYPTVPFWQEEFDYKKWKEAFLKAYQNNKGSGISIYIHLPFCESMCTFCGCFKKITTNHSVEKKYIENLLKEWHLYCNLLQEVPTIDEIHLGGGTPTFFSSQNLETLINGIFSIASNRENCDMSFEGHPNNTTKNHLEKLYELGFKRVSFGVQDYSERVQLAINRHQTYSDVAKVTMWAKDIGYTSVCHDLIFGLPFQRIEDVVETIEKTKLLAPDRISFYSYAHVPWIKGNGQRGFKEEDIPKDSEKRILYEIGKNLLQLNGYEEIGMDHFALKSDSLYDAFKNKKLHRNFMGYSSSKTNLMIGLGVSAIGDSWNTFYQNSKNLDDYYQMLEWGELPIVKGHILSDEDLFIRKHILNLMCQFETSWDDASLYFKEIPDILNQLKEMETDGLLTISSNKIVVTETGKAFVRNICMAFDLKMKRAKPEVQLFSMTI